MGVDEYKEWTCLIYDNDESGDIAYSEMVDALMAYLTGDLEYSQMVAVLMCYLTS